MLFRSIAREYETAVKDVQTRIERAARPKPSIYIELGNRGTAEQGPSYGDFMWGKIADVAGGRNIGKGIVATFGALSAEQVLASKPDVIVLAGSEWRNNATASMMGQDVDPTVSRARLQGFAARPGWATIPAVQNGRVHGVYQGISRTIVDYVSVQYFAKLLYPDLFADLDPQATYLAFYKRYLPIVPEGAFMVSIR